jgi:hypothetical protein
MIDASELYAAADRLHTTADDIEDRLEPMFVEWVDSVYAVMHDEEVPVDQGDLRDSIEVFREGLSAEIRPTLRVEGAGGTTHSLGHILEYGRGSTPPDPFMARTAARAPDEIPDMNLGDVL